VSEDRVRTGRIVDVWARISSREGSYGSGYLVAPRLIITALHVVAAGVPAFEDFSKWESAVSKPYADIKIRLLQGQRWWTCKVLWPTLDTSIKFDAALLQIIDEDWLSADELSRWGRPTVEDSRLTVGAIGFPSAQRRKDGTRDPERITGICYSATGMRSRHYQVVVTEGLPGDGSQWHGVSGAAVLCNDLVMALVTEYFKNSQGARLRALPIERLFEEEEFRSSIQTEAGSEPILESIELAPLLSPPVPPLRARPENVNFSPASLLRADAEVVRFRGRIEELRQLVAWCEAGGGCSVRLLVGPGGQGKSRLARQLAIQLQRNGWISGLLNEHADVESFQSYLQHLNCPTLLVVDYAEARPDQIRTLLNLGVSYQGTVPLRLLFIARSKGDWWDEFGRTQSAARGLLEDTSVDFLVPLEPTTDGRSRAYREALEDLANEFGQTLDDPRLKYLLANPPDLSHPRYAQALMVHMMALIPFLETRSKPPTDAQAIILAHEERYWSRTAARYGLGMHPKTLRVIVAALSLCGAVSQKELASLLLQVRGIADQSVDVRTRAELWLHDLYPLAGIANREESPLFVGTLVPDRLAEYLVVDVFENDLEVLIELLSTASEKQAQHAFSMLASAAAFDRSVDGILKEVVKRVPPLALAAARVAPRSENPAPLVAAVSQLVPRGIDESKYPDLWTQLYRTIHPRSAVFAEVSVSLVSAVRPRIGIIRLLSELFPERKRELAIMLGSLFIRLYNARRYGEALDIAREEVDIYRLLSPSGGDADVLRLAVSLKDLCIALRAMGHHEESLTAIQEAVAIYKNTQSSDESSLIERATALYHFSDALVWAGAEGQATSAVEESLRIRETLASHDPNQLVGLMNSLSSLAARRHKAGRAEIALELSEQSIRIGERLLDRDRDLYLRDVATCVELRAGLLFDAGRLADTLATDTHLVELRRELARSGGTGYLVDLAWALSSKARHFQHAGLEDDALRVSNEAMAVFERLPGEASVDISNANRLFRIAEILYNHSRCLALVKDHDAAYSVSQLAVDVYQRLAEQRPLEYAPALADALRNLALRACEFNKLQESSTAIEKAIDIWNSLVMVNLHKYEPRLANFSLVRGFVAFQVGDFKAAVCSYALGLMLARKYDHQEWINYAQDMLDHLHTLFENEDGEVWWRATIASIR
jgi:tetratricopeptide (TPR) repeat protein